MFRSSFRSSLIPLALLAALPAEATSLVSSRVVERGDTARVTETAGTAADEAGVVDVVFGMGRSASRGFVAAAGGADSGVTVARGPRPEAAFCPPAEVRLP